MTVQAWATESPQTRPFVPSQRGLAAVPSRRPALPLAAAGQVAVKVIGTDPLSREGVIRFLQECPDVQVVADATAGRLDVVVVVVDRVGDATVRTLRSIRGDSGPLIVLVVGELDPTRAAEVMQAGTVAIVRRGEVTRGGLRRVIRSVLAGEAVVPPDVLAGLLGRGTAPSGPGARLGAAGLNDREEKVLRLLADGCDTREIGHTLCYSERTVKTIIQDITHRFGLRNRSHAVAYAIRQGLI